MAPDPVTLREVKLNTCGALDKDKMGTRGTSG
jgi:hypothetical protein